MIFKRKPSDTPPTDPGSEPGAPPPGYDQVLSLSQTGETATEDFFDDLATEIRISKAQFDTEAGELRVNGWCLTPEAKFDLLLEVVGTDLICEVTPATQERMDVFQKMPQYGNKTSGWQVKLPVEALPEKAVARISYVSEDRMRIFNKDIVIPPASSPFVGESLKIKNCSYSPLRSLCIIDLDIVSDRETLAFDVTTTEGIPLGPVQSRVAPANSKGIQPVRLNILVSGLQDRQELQISETGNPALRAEIAVSTLKDAPRRITATTPSVRQNLIPAEEALDLASLIALKKGLADHPRPAKAEDEVCYFPAFEDAADLSNHYHRASWYLTGPDSPISRVTFAAPDAHSNIAPPPDHFASRSLDAGTLDIIAPDGAYIDALLRAKTILVWRPLSKGLQRYLSKILGKAPNIITVATNDPASVEYGNYCKGPWLLLPEAEKQKRLQESQDRFRAALQAQRDAGKTCSAVFGTGPSIDTAFEFDFSTCMTVACNSVVANAALLDHIRPTFICAGDAVSHFGVSQYAETFRTDLIKALTERDIYLFTSAAIGFLLVQNHPEIRDRVILCEQRFSGLNCDLEKIWSLPRFDSTLNIHMLPIAASFSDTVYMLGLDGRDPNPANNEDFWAHSKAAQYHDLVDSGHLAHPTFTMNRAQATESRYLASVQESFLAGEALGKSFFALAPSFTPPVHARPAPDRCFEPSDVDGRRKLRIPGGQLQAPRLADQPGKTRALIVMQMNRRHFSGGRYHGTMLAEAMAEFCDDVVVWTNNMPPWSGDLSFSPHHHKVHYEINDFLQPPAGDFDYVIVLPDGSRNPGMYYRVFEKAKSCNAKTAFLNFESLNWFNALSPAPKKLSDVDNWFAATCFSDIILSSAETAVPFAERFYKTLFHTPTFAVAPPAINSPIADLVKQQNLPREKQIILISRFGNVSAHKNINAIFDCITPEMKGYTLALIAGTSDLPDDETLTTFRNKLDDLGLSLKLLYMISDREKYEEIAKSELMIFPSLFEGFGYPPVEAGYMGTPCIAYDLPVLQEFNADHAHFVPWGDEAALRAKISEVLQQPQEARVRCRTPQVLQTANLETFSRTLKEIFTHTPAPTAASSFSTERFEVARKIYLDECHESDFPEGVMSKRDLSTLLTRYERLASEMREKLQARRGDSGAQV